MRLKRSVRTVILLSVFMTIAGCARDSRKEETMVETAVSECAVEDDADSAKICAGIFTKHSKKTMECRAWNGWK